MASDTDMQIQFEQELSWCIAKLRDSLRSGNLNDKRAKEAVKTLKSLESPKAPMPKKRMLMRAAFGDYRAQMEGEIEKYKLDVSVKESAKPPGSSKFFKKSTHSNPLEDDSAPQAFKFNFEAKEHPKTEATGSPSESSSSKLKFQPSDNSFKFGFERGSK